MASSSPSEFLTFMRTIRTTTMSSKPALRCLARPTTVSRPFTTSHRQHRHDNSPDQGPGKEHTLDKVPKKDPNVQTDASGRAREQRSMDSGGHATQQRDSTKSAEKSKKDNPKAPQPVIGIQDERGGKGLS